MELYGKKRMEIKKERKEGNDGRYSVYNLVL